MNATMNEMGRIGGRRVAAAVALASMVLALAPGCARERGAKEERGGARPMQAVGPLRIAVGNQPETPTVGDNRMSVQIQDSTGAPVRGATVEVLVVMQAMGAMPRMESRGEGREVSPGSYEAKYGLAMAGEWDVDIKIRTVQGTQVEAAYRLSTTLKEVSFVGGTPASGAGAAAAGAPASGHVHGGGGGGDIAGAVRIDASRRQEIGVRTAPAEYRVLSTTVRAAGRVGYDETRRAEVSLKFSGWVRDIRVDYTGRAVRAGDVLFTAYSPELFAAQQEYLTALGAGWSESAGAPASPDLAQAARQRLLLWDITPQQIDAIARSGKPMEAVPIVSPASGVVTEKNVVKGSAFMAAQTLYKIAPVHPVWVIASVYPFELSLVRTGLEAKILSPFLPERSRVGRISWVSPYLESDTRTGEVRIEVPNARGDLKPAMFVDVTFDVALGRQLAIPESAVLYVGDRRVVFVDLGDGRLAPRDVVLGAKAGDYFQVRAGLQAGEAVVTSGNFLVAAESRLKSAAQKW